MVLGWVYIGTQTSAGSIKAAIASIMVPVLGRETDATGECIGIRDRTTFDESCTHQRTFRHFFPGRATMTQSSQTRDRSEDIPLEDGISIYSQQDASTSADPEQQLQSLLEPEH